MQFLRAKTEYSVGSLIRCSNFVFVIDQQYSFGRVLKQRCVVSRGFLNFRLKVVNCAQGSRDDNNGMRIAAVLELRLEFDLCWQPIAVAMFEFRCYGAGCIVRGAKFVEARLEVLSGIRGK